MIMKVSKKIFVIAILLNLVLPNGFSNENKSITISIWQHKNNVFNFQNNEFEVSLNFVDWTLNPVILNKQKQILLKPDGYVEILEMIELNENKYVFCFSSLGFEQVFIYDLTTDKIIEPFFDMKSEVSIRARDFDNLVLFGDSWNSDKGIAPNQIVSLYLFSTYKQQHYKIAEKKGDVFYIKLLDDCKVEYVDQNGKVVQFDYSEWIKKDVSYEVSSFLVEGKTVYGAENLSSQDGLPWASSNGYGINDTIRIKIPLKNVMQLSFYNGYQSDKRPDLYNANSRVKRIRITNLESEISKEYIIKDSSEVQNILVSDLINSKKLCTTLEITILEVYPGERFKDLCIQAIIPN